MTSISPPGPSPDPELSVVVIVGPLRERAAGCLASLLAQEAVGRMEVLLVDLLRAHRSGPEPVANWLSVMIARRAMRPDHLWQDLGLNDRGELNRLLARHFRSLHAGNTGNMRWKKYFYRVLCDAEGFSLCAAPSCAVCTDFNDCFGAEDGLSLLAGLRRRMEEAA